MNIGNCPEYADAKPKKVIELMPGDKMECPCCHKNMLVEVKSGPDWKKIVLGIVGIAALGGGISYFVSSNSTKTEGGETLPPDIVIVDTTEVEQPPFENPDRKGSEKVQSGGNITGNNGNNDIVAKEGELDLGFAIYDGETKNGKPHGKGIMTYKRRTLIEARDPQKRYAEKGDYVSGKYNNGHLEMGQLHRTDGSQSFLNIGKSAADY